MLSVFIIFDSSLAEDIANKLIPNLGSFLTQFFAFLVFILIVFLFGYKPIRKMVKKRQDYVSNQIKEAAEKNKAAELVLNQSQEKILASQREANDIIEQAKVIASNEKEKILNEASKDVIKMKKQAEQEIAQMEVDEKEHIHDEMVSIALSASSELLKRNITSDDNEKLVDNFIKEMES